MGSETAWYIEDVLKTEYLGIHEQKKLAMRAEIRSGDGQGCLK